MGAYAYVIMTCFKSKFIIYKVVLYGNIEAEIRKMMHSTSFLITELVTYNHFKIKNFVVEHATMSMTHYTQESRSKLNSP